MQRLEVVRAHRFGILTCKPSAGRPSRRPMVPRFTTSATARGRPAVPPGAAARGQLHRPTEPSTGAELPRFIEDEFGAFLPCDHDKVPAFSCNRPRFCPSCVASTP